MTLDLDFRSKAPEEPGRRGRILIVEDDAIQRRVLARLLARWRFEPVEAADGGEGIERLREAAPGFDALILDMMLPVVDGLGVARFAVKALPGMPILACSAAFNDQIKSDLRDLGVRHFLEKPYAVDDLQAILHRLVAGRAGAEPEPIPRP